MNSKLKEFLLQATMLLLVAAIFGAGVLFGMTLVPPRVIVVERSIIRGYELLWGMI